MAPAPGSKYQEEEDDARRVLSDKRPDAEVMREYLTDQVADNPEIRDRLHRVLNLVTWVK